MAGGPVAVSEPRQTQGANKRSLTMTDRRELIRNGASWAVALSLAAALSTTGSEAQPTPRREPPHRGPVWQRG